MKALSLFVLTLFLATAGLLLSTAIAWADVVVLENGDHLSGRILKATGGVLELETEYAGVIKLQTAAVAEISTDAPLELHLTNGEVLKGRVTTLADKQLQVAASGDRTATAVNWAQVAAINPPPAEAVRWHGDVTLGGTMKSGNTDSRDTSVALSGVRRGERDRISLKLRYDYGEEDKVRTAESTYGAMKYDYFVTDKFYSFLSLELLIDEFKDLNLRTLVGPGVGYQFFEEESKALAVEAGLSYFNEDRDAAEDQSWLSARLGANLRYRLFDWLSFTDELLVYPSLEEMGEYQLRNEAALISSLSGSWAFKFTNIYEYDSLPAPGVKNNDLTWILGLQYAY